MDQLVIETNEDLSGLAERVGFEPTILLQAYQISNLAHSTGLCHLSVTTKLVTQNNQIRYDFLTDEEIRNVQGVTEH